MSGPKADEITMTAQRLELEMAMTTLAELRSYCKSMFSDEVPDLRAQWTRLGLGEFPQILDPRNDLRSIEKKIDLENARDASEQAIRVVEKLREVVSIAKNRVHACIVEAQRTYSRAAANFHKAQRLLLQIENIPPGVQSQGIEVPGLADRVRKFVDSNPLPAKPLFSLDHTGLKNLPISEKQMADFVRTLEAERDAILDICDDAALFHTKAAGVEVDKARKILNRALGPVKRKFPSFVTEFHHPLEERFALVEARAATLVSASDREAVDEALKAARDDPHSCLQQAHLIRAELLVSEAFKRADLRAQWEQELDRLYHSLERGSDDSSVMGLRDRLTQLREDEACPALEPLKSEAARTLAVAARGRQAGERRKAVLDSMKELGYEIEQAAAPSSGRWIFRQPGEEEYAVAIMSDAGLESLQMQVVRMQPSSSSEAALQDREREEAFCVDHKKFKKAMAVGGYNFCAIKHVPPGVCPVPQLTSDRTEPKMVRHQKSEPKARRAK